MRISIVGFEVRRDYGALAMNDLVLTQYEITNLLPLDLMAVHFTVTVADLFGEALLTAVWHHDQRIVAFGAIRTDPVRGLKVERFNPNHARVLDMDRAQLRVALAPLRIALADGRIIS